MQPFGHRLRYLENEWNEFIQLLLYSLETEINEDRRLRRQSTASPPHHVHCTYGKKLRSIYTNYDRIIALNYHFSYQKKNINSTKQYNTKRN